MSVLLFIDSSPSQGEFVLDYTHTLKSSAVLQKPTVLSDAGLIHFPSSSVSLKRRIVIKSRRVTDCTFIVLFTRYFNGKLSSLFVH